MLASRSALVAGVRRVRRKATKEGGAADATTPETPSLGLSLTRACPWQGVIVASVLELQRTATETGNLYRDMALRCNGELLEGNGQSRDDRGKCGGSTDGSSRFAIAHHCHRLSYRLACSLTGRTNRDAIVNMAVNGSFVDRVPCVETSQSSCTHCPPHASARGPNVLCRMMDKLDEFLGVQIVLTVAGRTAPSNGTAKAGQWMTSEDSASAASVDAMDDMLVERTNSLYVAFTDECVTF